MSIAPKAGWKQHAGKLLRAACIVLPLLAVACTTQPHDPPQALSVAQARRAMFRAVKKDDPRQLRHALQAHPDVNQTDASGYTPLLLAARWGNSSCIKLLLDAPDIDVNKVVEDGETALYKAAGGGHSACVRLLMKARGIDVNKAELTYGWTPLMASAIDRHDHSFRLLLRAPGLNINQKDFYGVNVLFHAAFNGNRDGVRRLLRMGIDTAGFDAAEVAILRNDTTALKQLIAAGYDVNKRGLYRMAPILWAAGLGRTECIRLLLAAGADAGVIGPDSGTALQRAAGQGYSASVKHLLQAPGVDANRSDEEGDTPLHYAAYCGYADCIRHLLQTRGIEINKVNEAGETPLYMAAMQGHEDCVRLLLRTPGIRPNKADIHGKTPLQVAEERHHEECAELLKQAR